MDASADLIPDEDDEFERELEALRSNVEFMEFLTECETRGRTRPRKTLDEFRRETGDPT